MANGLLSQLVSLKAEKDKSALTGAIGGVETILKDPDATPEAKEWAINSLQTLTNQEFHGGGSGAGKSGGGGAGKIGDFFKTVLSGMAGGHPNDVSGGVKDQLSASQQGRPSRMFLTEEEKQGAKERATASADKERLDYEEKLQKQRDAQKFVAEKQQEAENRRVALVYDNEDYDRWTERGTKLGLSGRDLAEFAATKGQKLPAGSTAAPKVAYGIIKGQEGMGYQPVTFNPRDPHGYVDADGNEYSKDDVSGVSNTRPQNQKLYGNSLLIDGILQGKGYKPGSPEYEYYFGREAQRLLNVQLGRTQQLGAIDQYSSGIGMGPGLGNDIPTNPNRDGAAGGNPAPGPQGGKPALTPAGGQPPQQPPGTPGQGQGQGSGAAGPTAFTPFSQIDPKGTQTAKPPLVPRQPAAGPSLEQERFNSNYLSKLFGDAAASGKSDNIGVMKGREFYKKLVGADALDFSLIEAAGKDNRKAAGEILQRAAATNRVNEVLNEFGEEVLTRAKDLTRREPDLPILKTPIRALQTSTIGNEELRRFLVALNGFQRQYAVLTSGSPQSIAQLPVSVREDVEKIISPTATLGEVIGLVDQVKVEGKRERDGFKNAFKDTVNDISTSFGGKDKGKSGEDKEYNGHTYHRDKAGDPWKLVK